MKEWIIGLICAGFAFFSPIYVAVIGMFVFVTFDMITGIWSAYKRGDKIESKKMRTSIGKFIAYFLLLILSHVMDNIFIVPFLGKTLFLPFISFLIGSIEFMSLIENFQKILDIPDLKSKIYEFLAQNKRKD